MIVVIKDVYLYTGLTTTGGNDSAAAYQWLQDNNIEFTHLSYNDSSQYESVFNALNTWDIGEFTDFPFVIYDEKHDDFTAVKQALIGLDAITESNLVELAAL
jgi:hypothetical protein